MPRNPQPRSMKIFERLEILRNFKCRLERLLKKYGASGSN